MESFIDFILQQRSGAQGSATTTVEASGSDDAHSSGESEKHVQTDALPVKPGGNRLRREDHGVNKPAPGDPGRLNPFDLHSQQSASNQGSTSSVSQHGGQSVVASSSAVQNSQSVVPFNKSQSQEVTSQQFVHGVLNMQQHGDFGSFHKHSVMAIMPSELISSVEDPRIIQLDQENPCHQTQDPQQGQSRNHASGSGARAIQK